MTQDALNPSSKDFWQHIWNVANQGISETQWSGISLGPGQMGTPCQARIQVPIPMIKAGVQNTPYCLYKQYRHSESVLSIKELSQNPGSQLRCILVRPFKEYKSGLLWYSFVHSYLKEIYTTLIACMKRKVIQKKKLE